MAMVSAGVFSAGNRVGHTLDEQRGGENPAHSGSQCAIGSGPSMKPPAYFEGGCPFPFAFAGEFLTGQNSDSVRAVLRYLSKVATTSGFSLATFFFSPGSDFRS